MAENPWSFDTSSRRYRSTATGRYLSASSERSIRDDFTARSQAEIATVAGRVAAGETSVAAWERQMQRSIRELHGVDYALGRGGRKQVSEQEWARLERVVADQERYLADFAAQVARGELTAGRIAARAALYAEASRASYHRGRAATYEGLILPAMPADGGTICLVQCRCEWVITETENEWEATWTLQAGESCLGCQGRRARWSPLIQAKPSRVAA